MGQCQHCNSRHHCYCWKRLFCLAPPENFNLSDKYAQNIFPLSSDYKLFSRSVIFRPGKKESCVNVKIVDDNEVELDREEFEIVLSINSPFVQVDPKANTAVITIVDNDKGKLVNCGLKL